MRQPKEKKFLKHLLTPPSKMIANPPKSPNQHFLCILIPFRDRFQELEEFVPAIKKHLSEQNIGKSNF